MSNTPLPEPLARLMKFAGKRRNEVSNPCFTARECIAMADQVHAHAAAVTAAKDAEIAGLRERLQKMSDTMKGMDAHEAGLAEAQAYLMERVKVLEDALQAASDAILHIRDMHWTHWTAREQQEAGDAAFAARAALGDKI